MTTSENPHTVEKSIVILGGGTAGWMAANLLQHHLAQHGFKISLVESPDIGIIGVGEGSTPQMKQFFNTLGISEQEWMSKCHATFKNGIKFQGWSSNIGFQDYFHPFASFPDKQTAGGFLVNCLLRRQGHDVDAHPDQYFLSAYLAKNGLSPKTQANFPVAINYAYHFDSAKLGNYLQYLATDKGVKHIQSKIQQVQTHPSGDIKCLVGDKGEEICADWFIDCSGFSSVLLQKTLGVEFVSFADNLFNDSAVAIPSTKTTPLPVQTVAQALSSGWSWEIPLTNRIGNGYVYSSRYINAEEAETELRQKLNILDADVPVRHLNMRIGRVAKHWYKNCLAVGLSQGFIEPLEATALHLVQETIESFISAFQSGGFTEKHQNEFNQRINHRFDGIRDYIVCHYKMNTRTDTAYWLDNAANQHISASLSHIIECWQRGADLTAEIERQNIAHYYPAVSWHCLLAGYGQFPVLGAKQPASHQVNQQEISHFIQQCAKGFIPHQQALKLE
ncbi:tryptophan halogenase family protein [Aliiglaciecola sp. LCG003]|uniref:tryptophan halogenase family protein n=1 Tax=Aliiglaciecola sp. LCG003 TaxID=3053655 RepID=UPI00257324D3|nr:tryptophan halogenase family protein [Aliiglaciecola sp. LCG003]WJG07888.1 tryptophan 7-halogenase [Aliiglaciecola sp. LCG003]